VIGAITAGLFGTGVPPVTNSYESIASVTVGSGGAADVTFSSIPSTYKHLQIRWIARNTNTGNAEDVLYVYFNGDTSANYTTHFIYGEGAGSPGAVGLSNRNEIWMTYNTTASAAANIFGAGVTDILDYADTNKFKTLRNLGGDDRNGAGTIAFGSSLWRSTSALTSIKLQNQPGTGNWAQYTQFALYGIKG
jgi:hypothetical protein